MEGLGLGQDEFELENDHHDTDECASDEDTCDRKDDQVGKEDHSQNPRDSEICFLGSYFATPWQGSCGFDNDHLLQCIENDLPEELICEILEQIVLTRLPQFHVDNAADIEGVCACLVGDSPTSRRYWPTLEQIIFQTSQIRTIWPSFSADRYGLIRELPHPLHYLTILAIPKVSLKRLSIMVREPDFDGHDSTTVAAAFEAYAKRLCAVLPHLDTCILNLCGGGFQPYYDQYLALLKPDTSHEAAVAYDARTTNLDATISIFDSFHRYGPGKKKSIKIWLSLDVWGMPWTCSFHADKEVITINNIDSTIRNMQEETKNDVVHFNWEQIIRRLKQQALRSMAPRVSVFCRACGNERCRGNISKPFVEE